MTPLMALAPDISGVVQHGRNVRNDFNPEKYRKGNDKDGFFIRVKNK
jgi:hypothetical protein